VERQNADTPHPGIEMPTGTVVLIVPPKSAYQYSALYTNVYGIGVWLRDESVRWHENGEANAEQCCALASILHCYLALESYINLFASVYSRVPGCPVSAATAKRLDTLSTDLKWLLFPSLFTGVAAFDMGSEPLQSFTRLKRVRDNLIVHQKPSACELDAHDLSAQAGHPTMAIGGAHFGATPLTDWDDPTCDSKGAKWACDLARLMIEHLGERLKAARVIPSPPGLPEYPDPAKPRPKPALGYVQIRTVE